MSSRKSYRYVIADERLRAYARVPLVERLRWLDGLVRFTQAWRAAPLIEPRHERGATGDIDRDRK